MIAAITVLLINVSGEYNSGLIFWEGRDSGIIVHITVAVME